MRRKLSTSKRLPVYNDGMLRVYRLKQTATSFRTDFLQDTGVTMGFRELAIYDKTRVAYQARDLEVTKKLRVSQTTLFDESLTVIELDGRQHRVHNATQAVDPEGYIETELTCVKVQIPYKKENELL